jgi:hypothetical protein
VLPSIVPDDRVKLSSRTVDGVFVVREVHHVGDSHQGDWVTEMLLVESTAATTDKRGQAPAPKTKVKQSNSGGSVKQGPNDASLWIDPKWRERINVA